MQKIKYQLMFEEASARLLGRLHDCEKHLHSGCTPTPALSLQSRTPAAGSELTKFDQRFVFFSSMYIFESPHSVPAPEQPARVCKQNGRQRLLQR